MIKGNRLLIGLMVVSALLLGTSAMAAEDITTAAGAGKLVIGANSSSLTIGLSKGVEVRYVNPGTNNAEAQWYVVASVHSGGNMGYATAQNLTNIMSTKYAPGEPTSTILTSIPVIAASKENWPAGPIEAWRAQ